MSLAYTCSLWWLYYKDEQIKQKLIKYISNIKTHWCSLAWKGCQDLTSILDLYYSSNKLKLNYFWSKFVCLCSFPFSERKWFDGGRVAKVWPSSSSLDQACSLRFGCFFSSGLGFLEIATHFHISFSVVKNLFSTQQNVSEGKVDITFLDLLFWM